MEMQRCNHESCRCCCCLCRDSATRRLECCPIECGISRERRQLPQKHRLSHESGSVVSTAGTATATPQMNGNGDYLPTRVVQNQVMSCYLLSIHIHPSWSQIPNRLVPTLVRAHAPGSLANECGTVQYNSGLYNSWGPFGRLVVQMVCLYPSQSHLFRMRVKRATTASILCVMNQTNDRRSGDE